MRFAVLRSLCALGMDKGMDRNPWRELSVKFASSQSHKRLCCKTEKRRRRDLCGRHQHISAVLQRLKILSRDRSTISPEQFLGVCHAVTGPRRAVHLAYLCYDSGFVWRYGDHVYTSNRDLQQTFQQKLPLRRENLERLLLDARAELAKQDAVKRDLDRIAYLGARRLFKVGLMAFVFQWLFFMRLTFVELSWDVMEPVAFFTTMFFALSSYGYFLLTYKIPKYAQVDHSLQSNRRQMLYRRAGFNVEAYDKLRKQVGLYEAYLKEFQTDE